MKNRVYNIFSFIGAGILGGFIVIFGMHTSLNESVEPTLIQAPVQAFHTGQTVANVNFDFTSAAEKATKSVVHIQASESELMANKRYNLERNNRRKQSSPIEDFFNPFSVGSINVKEIEFSVSSFNFLSSHSVKNLI